MEEARAILQQHDIKPSYMRILIMQYLMKHPTHPTVDRIYQDLSPENPTLSKTTVYNTLKLLAEKKAILSLSINEKNAQYDGDTSPHSHFLCRSCGAVMDLPAELISIPKEAEKQGLEIDETELFFYGLCKNCRK